MLRYIRSITFASLSIALLAPAEVHAECERETPPNKAVYKIGLVLGGGGARGLAHVGIISKLEAAGIRPDIIVGTSMGAVIGSLYAAGYNAEDLTQIAESLDWQSLFRDAAPRGDLAFRRKEEERTFSTGLKLGVDSSGVNVPRGIIEGRQLKNKIAELLSARTLATDFDDLSIPFRAIGTDIETFEHVVMCQGDLPSAVFASMAVPAILPPQKIGKRTIIDGGLAANVPVRIAKALGVETLIVVDLSVSPQSAEEIDNILGVLGQIATYLTLSNASKDIAAIEPQDLLISPDLGDYGSLDFASAKALIELGREALAGKEQDLARLAAMSKPAQLPNPQENEEAAPIINLVRIENSTRFPNSLIRAAIRQKTGAPLDYDLLTTDINKIYGIDEFGEISFRVEDQGDGTADVIVDLEPPDRGDIYVRFGLDLTTDFRSDTATNLSLGIIRRNLTPRGGEARGLIQIGNNPEFRAEFFQPTDARQRWFGSISAALERDPVRLFDDDLLALGELNLDQATLEIAAGRVVSRRLELRAGFRQRWVGVSQSIGLVGAQLPDNESLQTAFFQVAVDSFDDAFFPSKGSLGFVAYEANLTGGTSRVIAPSTLTGRTATALPLAGGVLVPATEFGFSLSGDPIVLITQQGDVLFSGTQTLGGPGRLSGLPPDALIGRHKVFGSLTYYRAIMQPEGLTGNPIYAGFALEAGDVFNAAGDISFDDVRYGGSVFVGTRTPLGPLVLGLGLTGGDFATFLSIGPTF